MLNDRDYMRGEDPRRNASDGFHALIALILINVFCLFIPDSDFSLSAMGIREGRYYQLITAMFLHADFFHLFFNMWALYVFGMLIAPVLGAKRFLILYFASGLVGNLIWLATSWNMDHYLVGASGAVMGVIIASAMMVPNVNMFLLFIPFPIKLRTMAVIFICIEIFNQLSAGAMGGIAYTAHIGGFLGGLLIMHFFYRRFVLWDPLAFADPGRRDPGGYERRQQPPPGWTVRDSSYSPPPPPPTGKVTQAELDRLLDKISVGGINSLSEAELARLRQAREQMRSGK